MNVDQTLVTVTYKTVNQSRDEDRSTLLGNSKSFRSVSPEEPGRVI